jgi:ABC-2 type transport system ATP-binding protein
MITIKNLTKQYGAIKELDNIHLSFGKGEIVFLVGPNGAGKSTLMKLITGFIRPTQGDVLINDKNVQEDRTALSFIGYVPENAPLYSEMTVYEYLKFVAGLWKLNRKIFAENLHFVIDNLQLREVLNQKIETLSKGFRRRVGIAGALIHKPQILILDEPTEGLDPNQKYQIHQFIKDYGQDHLLIVSTHIMEEVDMVADRVLMLIGGQLVCDTTPADMKKATPYHTVESSFCAILGD